MQEILYKYALKPILFQFDPEDVHDRMTDAGRLLGRFALTKSLTQLLFAYNHPSLNQTVAGTTFTNPIGLSAGFDKDAHLIDILPEVGFGYMQIGTVTYQPYDGNPKPRLTRLPHSKSICVNYGLKNDGVEVIARRIKKYSKKKNFPLGISIGKTNSRTTATIAKGILDYANCLKIIVKENVGDFYTINISCPNVFGGEPFTTSAKLDKLLKKLMPLVYSSSKTSGRIEKYSSRHSSNNTGKPVFLKMPINSTWKEFKQLCEVAIKHGVTGVIIGNLSKDRSLASSQDTITKNVKGNLSGKPTWELSNDLIKKTYRAFGKKLVIVGVGGVFSAEDAYEKIKRGASLVQLITGMIYEGPQLIGEINRELVELLKNDGYSNISEAVGAHHRSN